MLKTSLIIFSTLLLFGCNTATTKPKVNTPNPEKGKILFTNLGCVTCHSVTGEKKYGPSLNQILNTQIEVIQDGKTISINVDRDYLIKSIIQPDYQKAAGFERSKMAIPDITSEEVNCLVDYLVSVNSTDK